VKVFWESKEAYIQGDCGQVYSSRNGDQILGTRGDDENRSEKFIFMFQNHGRILFFSTPNLREVHRVGFPVPLP